jgi:zinc transport system ATP-binding protein
MKEMEPIIKLENISAAYDGRIVLKDVNLTVAADDYLGIIGPNGGGKTTLIKIILGLKKPASGKVRFYHDGKEVKNITMGYLPQYSKIDKDFPISVYEVVLSGLASQKKIFHPYSRAQIQQVDKTLEEMQLEELKKRPINALSGGQLQRVLLARALVSRPDVIVLDEPNTYIDKNFQAQMYEMLGRINEQRAIIIVSHDITEILDNVKHVACVNGHLHYHESTDIPQEKLEEHFLKM